MPSPERARTRDVKPASPSVETKAPVAPKNAAGAGMATRLPSPPVAAAILAGADRTDRTHPKAPSKRPPAARGTKAAEKEPATTESKQTTAPMMIKPAVVPRVARVAAPILSAAAKPANAPAQVAPLAKQVQVQLPAVDDSKTKPAVTAATPAAPAQTTAAPEEKTKAPATAASAAQAAEPAATSGATGGSSEAETASEADSAKADAGAVPEKAAGGKAEKGAKEGDAGGKEGKGPAEGEAGAEEEGGGGGSAVAVKLHMPEPPTGPSPATTRRIKGVKARAGGKATAHGSLPKGAAQVGDARKAVTEPDAEANAKAQAALIAEVQAGPSPEIVKLCERIREVIRNKRPPDEDALMEAKPEGEALNAGNQLNSTVEGETKKVQDNYGPVNAPPNAATPPKGADLPPQPAPAGTAPINAKAATPDAVPDANVSLDKDAAEAKKKQEDAGMNTPPAQLVQSGPVAEARAAQGELDQAAKEDPAKVLARQKESLTKAEGDMAALQAQALAALTTSRASTTKANTSRQGGMVGSEESMRTNAGAEAKKVFEDAKTLVNAQLQPLASTAMNNWEAAKEVLVTAFKNDLAVVQKRVEERHSGVGGFFTGIWDAVTGLPDWAEEAYTKAETNFGDGVIAKLTEISTHVNSVIATCDLIIKNARERIAKIFTDLPDSLKDWAAQEQAKFDGQLDQLHNEVIAARDNFNKDLMERSSAAVDEVRTEIAELRKKAGGLIGRIANAISRFIDDPIKFIIEGLLELLGIPPAAFWAVVAKIKQVIKDIADDPMKFANNLMDGLSKGFSQFFDNILSHLLKGFISWLTGGLAGVGVQLPKDLSAKSILTFFLQLMGITWPRIRKILVKHIGPKNVALIEKVYSLISMLIEKGPEGIYEMVKEKLTPEAIVDQIIQLAVDYMISAIIKAATARIIMLFNPVGAIVQALEAIYRVLKWIFQNAAKIFTLIETVVNGIADILAGNLGGFAGAVEKALAMLIAPVIGFIADYLGFGDLPNAIAKKIESFQEMVLGLIEQALVWFIEKGKALLAALGLGGKKDEKKKDGGKFDGQIGDKKHWKADDEVHELWIGEGPDGPEAMMASTNPGAVRKKLKEYSDKVPNIKGPGSKARKERAATAIDDATKVLDSTNEAAKQTKDAVAKSAAGGAEGTTDASAEVKQKDDETEDLEDQLWPHLQKIQIALGLIKLPNTEIEGGGGDQASAVTASPLSKKGKGGSRPYGKLKGWDHVMRIDHELLNAKTAQWGPAYWVAAHLVSEDYHGPGAPWNTVPARKTDNKAMEQKVENDTKERLAEEEVLYFRASVTFHSGEILEDFPQEVVYERGLMRYEDGTWSMGEALPIISHTFEKPPLDPKHVPDVNDIGRVGLMKRGLSIRFAMAIVEEKEAGGKFAGMNDFHARMTALYAKRKSAGERFESEHWPSLKALLGTKLVIGGEPTK